MKIVYIIKLEKNNSVFIGSTNNLEKCLKDHNLGHVKATQKKLPVTLICHFVFERDKTAADFEQFLKSKDGSSFLEEYFLLNPFVELKKLLATLPKSCKVFVMGGLALDGHLGAISRRHDDADLICWRKDVKTVKKVLAKLGYGIRENFFPENPKLSFRFETDEENSTISFNIIDEKPQNSFEISLGKELHQVFPKTFLGPKNVTLNGVKFPAVSYKLLDVLNKNAGRWFEARKKDNPKLYVALSYKVDNYKRDRKLLDSLIKK